jgi:two-component system OmpR family response regulator
LHFFHCGNDMNATPDPADLDFTKVFDGPAQPVPLLEASSEAEKKQVTAGAAQLQRSGYYINIAQEAKTVAPLQRDGRYSILCIEDDTVLLGILAKKLTLDGYEVRTASDRQTIVSELQRLPPPHLILLDVGLPGVSGFDVLQKLRQHPRLGSIPVIMLTGHVTPASVLQGMKGGADGYVSKPFQFDALTAAIKTVLGIR